MLHSIFIYIFCIIICLSCKANETAKYHLTEQTINLIKEVVRKETDGLAFLDKSRTRQVFSLTSYSGITPFTEKKIVYEIFPDLELFRIKNLNALEEYNKWLYIKYDKIDILGKDQINHNNLEIKLNPKITEKILDVASGLTGENMQNAQIVTYATEAIYICIVEDIFQDTKFTSEIKILLQKEGHEYHLDSIEKSGIWYFRDKYDEEKKQNLFVHKPSFLILCDLMNHTQFRNIYFLLEIFYRFSKNQ